MSIIVNNNNDNNNNNIITKNLSNYYDFVMYIMLLLQKYNSQNNWNKKDIINNLYEKDIFTYLEKHLLTFLNYSLNNYNENKNAFAFNNMVIYNILNTLNILLTEK